MELTFQPRDLVLVRACNVASAAAGKVTKFLFLYEGPYEVKKGDFTKSSATERLSGRGGNSMR